MVGGTNRMENGRAWNWGRKVLEAAEIKEKRRSSGWNLGRSGVLFRHRTMNLVSFAASVAGVAAGVGVVAAVGVAAVVASVGVGVVGVAAVAAVPAADGDLV